MARERPHVSRIGLGRTRGLGEWNRNAVLVEVKCAPCHRRAFYPKKSNSSPVLEGAAHLLVSLLVAPLVGQGLRILFVCPACAVVPPDLLKKG